MSAATIAPAIPTVHQLRSGGFLVDFHDGGFPVWCEDMGAVRRLLLGRALGGADTSPV